MALLSFSNPGQSTMTNTLSGASAGGVVRYPHPFFDVAQTYTPITVKHLFRWCHTYYSYGANGLVTSIINRLASYPITDRKYKGSTPDEERFFEKLFEDELDIESFLIECLIDYFVYGNAFISIHYPIVKQGTCTVCGFSAPISSVKYEFKDFKFKFAPCPNCETASVEAKIKDIRVPTIKNLRLVRWNPMDIDVMYNEVTGQSSYALSIPSNIKARIKEGNPLYLNETPQVFIDAVARGHRIYLSPQNIFHMKRPNLAGKDMGWGQPLIVPALKNLYLYQVLRKAQEAIAHEHIVPLRIIHPLPNGSADPVSTTNLSAWQSTMRTELLRWRKDPNYVPVVPMPIGFQFLGGQGRSLMLVNEIRQLSEQIAADLGVPAEFAFGGGQYSGAGVNIRILESLFLRAQAQASKLMSFLIDRVARFKGVNPVHAEFTSIRTADDVQRKQLLMSMAQSNKVSDRTLLSEFNIDAEEEKVQIERELSDRARMEQKQFLENAENQGKAQIIQARYQAEAQKEQMRAQERSGLSSEGEGQEGGQEQGQGEGQDQGTGQEEAQGRQEQTGDQSPVTLSDKEIQDMIGKLSQLPEDQMHEVLQKLKQYLDPTSFRKVMEGLQQKDNEVDMRPLPEQKPPRREKAVV